MANWISILLHAFRNPRTCSQQKHVESRMIKHDCLPIVAVGCIARSIFEKATTPVFTRRTRLLGYTSPKPSLDTLIINNVCQFKYAILKSWIDYNWGLETFLYSILIYVFGVCWHCLNSKTTKYSVLPVITFCFHTGAVDRYDKHAPNFTRLVNCCTPIQIV